MTYSTEFREMAGGMLTEFGQTVTLTNDEGTGSVNPATGAWAGGTAVTYPATCVVFPAKEIRRYGLIEGAEYIAFLSAENIGAVPKTGWTLLVGSDTFHILEVERLSPAGTDIMYTLMLRN